MTNSLSQLLDVADAIAQHLEKRQYELHRYDDGSYVDFHILVIKDLPALLEKAAGLELRILHEDNYIVLRIMENS